MRPPIPPGPDPGRDTRRDDGLSPARGIISGFAVVFLFWSGFALAFFADSQWPRSVCFADEVQAHGPQGWHCVNIEAFKETLPPATSVPARVPATFRLTTETGCQEDEVLAVQRDPDPAHGLTWACENIEEFIERAAR